MTDEELEQLINANRKQQQNKARRTAIGLKRRPYQTELTNLLYLLEDVVNVYERYKAINLMQSGTITEILENTIKGICNYIANDFD